MQSLLFRLPLASLSILTSLSTYAATPINLAHQPIALTREHINSLSPTSNTGITTKEITRATDLNQTLHVRIQQTYLGYPVWNSTGIVHTSHPANMTASAVTMNGIMYQGLKADLANTPALLFQPEQAKKAFQQARLSYEKTHGIIPTISHEQTQLIVYIDHNNQAHWAFQIRFYVPAQKNITLPAKPGYILDAASFHIYQYWNDIKSESITSVAGSGAGGNLKTKQLIYDGAPGHLASFTIQRDPTTSTCLLKNTDAIIKDERTNAQVQFSCATTSAEHNHTYWNDLNDQINGGYSPNTDAIFTITRVKEMYKTWYKIAPIVENGNAVPVTVYTHLNAENAYWEGKTNGEWRIHLGDGGAHFYPSTAPGVIAHELAHGFTEQHSNLFYSEQSGGLNESFSDMADQAIQYYAFGKNNWMHDAEIIKAKGKALRYMDRPSKDCREGQIPGMTCSIDNMQQYRHSTNVHFSSGIFNRVFYLIGTAKGWNTKKAFDVMVQANRFYWTSHTTFAEAACGVIKATQDYHYPLQQVQKAFTTVGINVSQCS